MATFSSRWFWAASGRASGILDIPDEARYPGTNEIMPVAPDRTMHERTRLSRRTFLTLTSLAAMEMALPGQGWSARAAEISFIHTHTGERLKIPYQGPGNRDSRVLEALNWFLRDFRTGEVHPIDPRLLDILYQVRRELGGGAFAVISGYRSPATNAMLRKRSGGVARRSLHMEGRAIDIRLSGVATRRIRACAMNMRCGGVGYYAKSDFVHLDTGRVRYW